MGQLDFGLAMTTRTIGGTAALTTSPTRSSPTIRQAFGEKVTKDDIFYYVYGMLQTPSTAHVRRRPEEDAAPHPQRVQRRRLPAVAERGRELADFHVSYEASSRTPSR